MYFLVICDFITSGPARYFVHLLPSSLPTKVGYKLFVLLMMRHFIFILSPHLAFPTPSDLFKKSY